MVPNEREKRAQLTLSSLDCDWEARHNWGPPRWLCRRGQQGPDSRQLPLPCAVLLELQGASAWNCGGVGCGPVQGVKITHIWTVIATGRQYQWATITTLTVSCLLMPKPNQDITQQERCEYTFSTYRKPIGRSCTKWRSKTSCRS